MKKNDVIKYVNDNCINLNKYNIIIGEKTNVPYSVGCYFEEGTWCLYEVGERQDFYVIKKGTEEEIFSHLYLKIRSRVKNR